MGVFTYDWYPVLPAQFRPVWVYSLLAAWPVCVSVQGPVPGTGWVTLSLQVSEGGSRRSQRSQWSQRSQRLQRSQRSQRLQSHPRCSAGRAHCLLCSRACPSPRSSGVLCVSLQFCYSFPCSTQALFLSLLDRSVRERPKWISWRRLKERCSRSGSETKCLRSMLQTGGTRGGGVVLVLLLLEMSFHQTLVGGRGVSFVMSSVMAQLEGLAHTLLTFL